MKESLNQDLINNQDSVVQADSLEGLVDKRVFSKTHEKVERKETADKIRAERTQYFNNAKGLEQQLSDLVAKAEQNKTQSEQLISELSKIEAELATQENQRLTKVLSFFHIEQPTLEEFRKQLSEGSAELGRLTKEYADLNSLISAIRNDSDDRSLLEKSKETLRTFHSNQSERFAKYLQEQHEIRDVKNVVQKHNVTFVHGIHPNFIPDSNSPLEKGVDWETKADIVLALNTSLSTSTIKLGDGPSNMWSRVGVILNGGEVTSAYHADAGTVASKPGTERDTGFGYSNPDTIAKEIDTAINDRRIDTDRGYNELTVNNPGVSGFYICREESMSGSQRNDDYEPVKIAQYCKNRGVPLYEIINGEVWVTEYDNKTEKVNAVRKLKPEELKQSSNKPSPENTERLRRKIMENSPFRFVPGDARFIDDAARGREEYIEIAIASGLPGPAPEGTENKDRVIAEFPRVGSKTQVIKQENGGFVFRRQRVWGGETDVFPDFRQINPDRYLTDIQEKIKRSIVEEPLFCPQKTNEKEIDRCHSYHNDLRQGLAARLVGFGIQATERGDVKTAEAAFSVANPFMTRSRYDSVQARRVDSSGRLHITEEELN